LLNTLLFRLTVLYTLTFTLLAIISFSVFYYRIYAVTMERLDEELLAKTKIYSEYLTDIGLSGITERLVEEAKWEHSWEEFYRIIDFKGNVLYASDMPSWDSVHKIGIFRELEGDQINHVFQTATLLETDAKARVISAVIGPHTILQIGETLEEADEYLEIFRDLLLILTVLLIMISALMGWLLAKRALIDMEEVTQTAEGISDGSYSRRVEIEGRFKETKRLGIAFNRMLDRIQVGLRSMQEINDNIAHDLRSPLARIRGIAEMTLMNEKSIDEYKEMAVNTIEECDSLIDMVNTMLELTETEAGMKNTADEAFDIVAVISQACEIFRPVADQKDIDIASNLPVTLPFHGSRKKMQRIVTNILENAIKYTPRHGKVAVSARVEKGIIQISFNDNGVGISAEDLPHIFKRFYRCDRSRPQGGIGLGLCLVKAYTESMNGLISVTSIINEGSTFTLSLKQPHFSF